MAVFDLALSRHDHHNLELKFTVDFGPKPVEGQAELYLFVPATLRLSSYSKQEIMEDFSSKARLALSETQQDLDYLDRAYSEFEENLKSYDGTETEKLKESTLRLGGLMGEKIKHILAEHRELLENESAFSEEEIIQGMRGIRNWVDKVLALTRPFVGLKIPYVHLLHDYSYQHYTHYLGKLLNTLKSRKSSYDWTAVRAELQRSFEGVDASHHLNLWEDPLKLEQYYLRLSHLKKLFQSTLFVDVNRTKLVRRIAEPAAATAAGLAALWASIFQQFQQPGMIRFGLSSISFICAGVIVYIFKDRIKERTRQIVTRNASRYLADLELEFTARGKSFGVVREWFELGAPVPNAVNDARAQYRICEAECHIPEEVFQYKRTFCLPPRQNKRYQALHELVRIKYGAIS